MSLPVNHPPVNHLRGGKKCPVTGDAHEFRPAQPGDMRSPCPALNTMANHGYIARDGKNVSAQDITRGLKKCYGLSSPLAYFLSYVGFIMIHQFGRRISLDKIGLHNAVEHDASLVHHDTPKGQKYAPIAIDPKLVESLIRDIRPTQKDMEMSSDPDATFLLNYEDIARSRIRREDECRPIDSVHAEIARGEMAIILGVWETKTKTKTGIPVDYFRRWISEERLPDGWKPDHVQGLIDVKNRSKQIRNAAKQFRQEAAQSTASSSTAASSMISNEKL